MALITRFNFLILVLVELLVLAVSVFLDLFFGPFPYLIMGSATLTTAIVISVLIILFALIAIVSWVRFRIKRRRERKRLAEEERLAAMEVELGEEQPWLPEMEPLVSPPLPSLYTRFFGYICERIRNVWMWLRSGYKELSWERLFYGRGFLFGAVINFAAAILFFAVAFIVAPWYYALGYATGLTLLFVSYFGIAGLIKIDIGFKGVPTWFGGRLVKLKRLPRIGEGPERTAMESLFELKEGWNWILPRPIMGAEAIDVREQSIEVPKFTVVALGSISPDKPEDVSGVRVTIEPSTIRWRFDNPAQTLSIGEAVIRQSLVELVQNSLRQRVSHLSDIQALQTTDELRNGVKGEADAKADEWGMNVISFLIGEISLPEDVHKDYERLRREERQRKAERLELDHIRDRLNELIAMGYTRERAQEIVQTERGKVKKEIRENQISVSPETGQVIERIASLFRR